MLIIILHNLNLLRNKYLHLIPFRLKIKVNHRIPNLKRIINKKGSKRMLLYKNLIVLVYVKMLDSCKEVIILQVCQRLKDKEELHAIQINLKNHLNLKLTSIIYLHHQKIHLFK